jgi:hypothetical protein
MHSITCSLSIVSRSSHIISSVHPLRIKERMSDSGSHTWGFGLTGIGVFRIRPHEVKDQHRKCPHHLFGGDQGRE